MIALILGIADRPLRIAPEDLLQHQHVIGATGVGKSTLLANEAVHAFEEGVCCVVIDPHGNLAHDIVRAVNPGDLKNVYLLDPLQVRFSLNPLELESYGNREIAVERVIGEITEFFRKLYGRQYWGPSLNRIFQDGLRALYERDDSPTMKDLYDLISGKISHREFQEELKKLPRGRTDSVLNKLAPFVNNRFLRMVLCRKPSSVRIEELMDERTLVIFRLPRGELSEMVSTLLGSAVITRVWFSVLSRNRNFPVILFIDEFHLFSHLETLGNIVSEGRKYGLGAVLAHQHTRQIPEALLNDILGNAGVKVSFRVSGEDARVMARSFGMEELAEKLVSLPDGRALVCIRGEFGGEARIAEISTLPLVYRNSLLSSILERMRELFEVTDEETVHEDPEIYELLNILLRTGSTSMSGLFEEYRKIRPGISAGDVSSLVERAEKLGFVVKRVERGKRGRPKTVVELSEKGQELCLGDDATARAGGELHARLAEAYAEMLRAQGRAVIFPPQRGREEAPDMIAFTRSEDGWRKIAVEVEVRADHPEQVRRNYEKNVKRGLEVIFVVPDDRIAERVRKIIGEKQGYRIEIIKYF
ncbi:type IV secretion system DNA-binding domain-containing protein [Archaeoglobus sp.]